MGLPHNHRRGLLLAAISAVALGLVAIIAIDGPLALAAPSLSAESRRAIQQAVTIVEVLF